MSAEAFFPAGTERMGDRTRVKKYIFRCNLSLGDIVLLTGAVRELHRHYPGVFATDVRTSFRELWRHNPLLTPLNEYDPEVTIVECQDRLVNRSGASACHALYGFLEFLNRRLGFQLRPTAFRGDLYLSGREKAGVSPVQELTGQRFPYWLVVAGGKLDFTAKWWDPRRYQEVIDRFAGRIQFVQVGDLAHYHPRLRGAVDLRGRTTVRQLVRLVYHAQGVLCGVTGLMHLASAVPAKDRRWPLRPCVVIAGGREPVHWEAYPGHQVIHTIGALPCCAADGCWKSRTVPLGDGDELDRPQELCRDVRNGWPHCLDLITSAEVGRRINSYFEVGPARFLTVTEARHAARAVALTAARAEPRAPLNICTAAEQAVRFVASLSHRPGGLAGRGIVICGGGARLFANAWVCVRLLRHLGCTLPIQLWHLGRAELDGPMRQLLRPLDVECVDGLALARKHALSRLPGEALRTFALLHSPFREILGMDADNFVAANPEYLFETPEYRRAGAVLWPGQERLPKTDPAWRVFGVSYRNEPVADGGQFLLDRVACWRVLALARWYDEHADFYRRHVRNQEERLRFAFHRLGVPFAMPAHGPKRLQGATSQHDFAGRVVFQHRNLAQWTLFPLNRRIGGFQREELCRGFLRELGERWDGRRPHYGHAPGRARTPASVAAVMISCAERERLRARTLRDWAQTDWGGHCGTGHA